MEREIIFDPCTNKLLQPPVKGEGHSNSLGPIKMHTVFELHLKENRGVNHSVCIVEKKVSGDEGSLTKRYYDDGERLGKVGV